MNEALRPSDEQMRAWLRNLDYWAMSYDEQEAHADATGFIGDDNDFPRYYEDEHDQYLRGLIGEVLEYRAFKLGEWAGVEQ